MTTAIRIIGVIMVIFGFILVILESEFKNYTEVLYLFIIKVIGIIFCYSGYRLFKLKK